MTPKKKETFSRVRTTFADCHEAESLVMRVDTWEVGLSKSCRVTVVECTLSLKFLISRSRFSASKSPDRSLILKVSSALSLRRSPCFWSWR
jgi:hypothetical protein